MKNIYRYLIRGILPGILIIYATSCRKIEYSTPELTTAGISEVTATSANSGGNVFSNGGSPITSRGVCWSTVSEPTIDNGRTRDGSGAGHFISNISGLSPVSTYYIRAYATNAEGTAYGNELTITTPPDTIATDPDGNVYHFITIGTQVWMDENLKTTKFADGSPIATTTPSSLDISLELTPNYQWSPNRDASYVPAYGRLYTGYTVESNMLCPGGWRVPTDSDWKTLSDFLGGVNVAGGKMKESGNTHWSGPNIDASNESGFTARGGGDGRDPHGNYDPPGDYVTYWSSTESGSGLWFRRLFYGDGILRKDHSEKNLAHYVRCIRDL